MVVWIFFVFFIFLLKTMKLQLFFSLSQGLTLLFQQNVGSKHLCNYLLNIGYIILCLLLQGFWFSFLIELFWLWELEYCTSFSFTNKFQLLACVLASKGSRFEQISLTFAFTRLQVWCWHYFLFFLHSSWCFSHSRV